MKIMVSSLMMGMEHLNILANAAEELNDENVGVELIAFTHDAAYWDKLYTLAKSLKCPISFHGPYIKTEGTSTEGSPQSDFLIDSYEKTIKLAKECKALHVVYHTTQRTFSHEESSIIPDLRKKADFNADIVSNMGRDSGVDVLIENLPCPSGRLPLYSNEEYFAFFERHKSINSIIDIGHANMNRFDIPGFLQSFGDRVKAYHFHNNFGIKDEHNDIMQGSFDFTKFSEEYKKYTPEATIVLEYEPHVRISVNQIVNQIESLRKGFS